MADSSLREKEPDDLTLAYMVGFSKGKEAASKDTQVLVEALEFFAKQGHSRAKDALRKFKEGAADAGGVLGTPGGKAE